MSRIFPRLRAVTAIGITIFLGLSAACGGGGDGGDKDGPTGPGNIPVASISVSPESGTLGLNKTLQLTATTRDAAGKALSGRTISWSASPATVGSVSSSGLVTSVAPGTLTVTATSEGQTGSASIVVINDNPVATVVVSPDTQTLSLNKTVQLSARVRDASGTDLTGRNIAWSATPATVGSVSSSGLVTAISSGTLTVVATSEGKTGTARITVINTNPVASVQVSPDTQTVGLYKSRLLSAAVKDSGGNSITGRKITWTATPATVGTVNDTGLVTTVAPGTLTITAAIEGKSGTARVTVINDNPVAVVTISSPVQALIPNGKAQLSATLKDSSGRTLTGRNITWTASPTTVGTVSSAGLVTAVAPGSLQVTATSEGKSAVLALQVITGATVSPSGGTYTLADGAVQLVVPAGAVTSPTVITAVPVSSPAAPLQSKWQAIGTHYALGPSGTTFAQPITVKLKFKSSELPPFAMSGDLKLKQAAGGTWSNLTDMVVDPAGKTISGRLKTLGSPSALRESTTGFGFQLRPAITSSTDALNSRSHATDPEESVGIIAEDPTLTLSPQSASVNPQQRSVIFNANLAPNGKAVPLPANTPQLMYRWTSTGKNGSLAESSQWSTKSDAQYIATNSVLGQLSGPIDDVTVEVLLNPGETDAGKQRIVRATATVTADLEVTYKITPDDVEIGPGESKTFRLLMQDKQGKELSLPSSYKLTWESSANHGSIGSPGERQTSVVYQAKSVLTSQPPRVDDITVTAKETVSSERRVYKGGAFGLEGGWDEETVSREVTKGTAKAFVEVKIEYKVELTASPQSIAPDGQTTISAVLTPAFNGPGIKYKWKTNGQYGTLNVANGVRTDATTVTYTGKNNVSGVKTERVEVEVVSFLANVELETLARESIDITITSLSVTFGIGVFPTPGGWLTTARITVPKVAGAKSYRVTADLPDGPLDLSFSGATTTDPQALLKVYDAGDSWKINIDGGYNTIPYAQQAREQIYRDKYGSIKFNLTITQ